MGRSGASSISTAARTCTGRSISASRRISTPERRILDSITQNTTGRPIVAQMIGNDIPALVRTAKVLQEFPIAAVDLNLGCPAPIVYRKWAGGGLLRDPQRIDAILGALREAVRIPFTVKTRVGFASVEEFDQPAADLREALARCVDRARADRGAVVQAARPLRPDPPGVRGDAVSGDCQRPRQFRGAGTRSAGEHRMSWPDDRPRRHPQSVAVHADPAAPARRARHAAHGTRRLGVHPRALVFPGQSGPAREVAVRADEEVPQLSRRRRARAVPAADPPLADGGRVRPHLRRVPRSRSADERWTPPINLRRDHARLTNSRVSVCTLMRSPSLTNSGTRTSMPVSSVAALVTLPLLVSPRTAGSV